MDLLHVLRLAFSKVDGVVGYEMRRSSWSASAKDNMVVTVYVDSEKMTPDLRETLQAVAQAFAEVHAERYSAFRIEFTEIMVGK